MDIIAYIVQHAADNGTGRVEWFQKKGKFYFYVLGGDECEAVLFIVPLKVIEELEKQWQATVAGGETEPDDEDEDSDTVTEFWDTLNKYAIGQFEPS